jgi:hypothetical protein
MIEVPPNDDISLIYLLFEKKKKEERKYMMGKIK